MCEPWPWTRPLCTDRRGAKRAGEKFRGLTERGQKEQGTWPRRRFRSGHGEGQGFPSPSQTPHHSADQRQPEALPVPCVPPRFGICPQICQIDPGRGGSQPDPGGRGRGVRAEPAACGWEAGWLRSPPARAEFFTQRKRSTSDREANKQPRGSARQRSRDRRRLAHLPPPVTRCQHVAGPGGDV